MAEVERKHTLRRLKAGDYLLLSNDTRTLWRIYRYEDGPSYGIEDWPKDREFWGLRRWETPIVIGETGIEIDNWHRWPPVADAFPTRAKTISAALKRESGEEN